MPPILSNEQVAVLRQTHRQLRDKKLADRIKAVLYLNYGLGYAQTAKLLMLEETTLRRYARRFKASGVNGLLACHWTGGTARLSLPQEQTLKAYLRDNTQRTAKDVVAHIKETYGVSFSTIGVTKLLHRLGFAYKKPKVVPGKADRLKQEQFLKIYREVKSQLDRGDHLYFVDSTHPQHNTRPSAGWILKGKANDKLVKTNSGRDRLNLNGALSFEGRSAIVLAEKTVNSQATLHLFETIKKKHPHNRIYLVLDNASHHHSLEVRHWLLHHPRFKPIFLPPYSPNLNLIERLWRFFHQRVTYNRYFETLEEFRTVSLDFFNNLNLYQAELLTLLTDNFQLAPDLNQQT